MNRCRIGDFLYFLIAFSYIAAVIMLPVLAGWRVMEWLGWQAGAIVGLGIGLPMLAFAFVLPQIVLDWLDQIQFDKRCR